MRTPAAAKNLLIRFVSGSFFVLLFCLVLTAGYVSFSIVQQEKERSEIFKTQILRYFELQHVKMAEEMWTESYDAIVLRVERITKALGGLEHEVVILDSNAQCRHVHPLNQLCMSADQSLKSMRDLTSSSPSALFYSDQKAKYVFVSRLDVGSILKGFIEVRLNDPFRFYHKNGVTFALGAFALPILLVLFVWLSWMYYAHRALLRPHLDLVIANEKKSALGHLAAQVAHDIRSPLVAMKSVLRMGESDLATNRALLVASASRIEAIADDLLHKFRGASISDAVTSCFAAAVVESIVAEKRVVLGSRSIFTLDLNVDADASFVRASIDGTKLGRVISNLINNAIEAIPGSRKGEIRVSVAKVDSQLRITITDNGSGVSTDVVTAVQNRIGKSSKPGGNGLGLAQAMETIGEAGGRLDIGSNDGQGTIVSITLPLLSLPSWCAPPRIDLRGKNQVAVLDDDEGVRALWIRKLKGLKVLAYADPQDMDMKTLVAQNTFFILDHEISLSPVTGLDLIRAHQLGSNAILATSHFEDRSLQASVLECGSRILPKFLVENVEMSVAAPGDMAATRYDREKFDAVLIDDDELVHAVWKMSSKNSPRKIAYGRSFEDINWSSIDPLTPVYVDKNLANSFSGLDIAHRIHSLGFNNIFLATGEVLDAEELPPFIRACTGKDYPLES